MLLNKIVIPAILVSITLVAGIFALMPIEKAGTVHTTIQATLGASVGESFRISSGGSDLGGAGGESTFTLSCTDACIVDSIHGWTTSGEDGDIVCIINITGVVDVLDADLVCTATNNDLGDLSIGGAPSNIIDLLKMVQSLVPSGADESTISSISVAAGGTVVVGISNSVDGDSSASFVVVFTGKNLGNTVPTVAFVA